MRTESKRFYLDWDQLETLDAVDSGFNRALRAKRRSGEWITLQQYGMFRSAMSRALALLLEEQRRRVVDLGDGSAGPP